MVETRGGFNVNPGRARGNPAPGNSSKSAEFLFKARFSHEPKRAAKEYSFAAIVSILLGYLMPHIRSDSWIATSRTKRTYHRVYG